VRTLVLVAEKVNMKTIWLLGHILMGCLFDVVVIAAQLPTDTAAVPAFSSLTLEINGSRMVLTGATPFEVVAGDLFTIFGATAGGTPPMPVERIDVVGFTPSIPKAGTRDAAQTNDMTYVIDTTRDLQRNLARGADRTEFEIKGFIGKKLVASRTFKVIPARLDKVEITLNGALRVLRDGDVLVLKASDRISVKSVVTNIPGNEHVHYELRTKKPATGGTSKELTFARGEQVIGRIPIKWQE